MTQLYFKDYKQPGVLAEEAKNDNSQLVQKECHLNQ